MPGNGDKKDGRNRKMLQEDVYRTEWTAEEQRKLEQAMSTYSLNKVSGVQRYVLIAEKLEGKTVRDVALRVRWMKERETARARKESETGGNSKKARTPRLRDPDTPSIFATGQMPPGMGGPGGMGGMGPQGHLHPQMMMGGGGGGGGGHPMGAGGGGVMHGMHRALMLEDHGRETVGSLDGPPNQMLEQNVGLIHSVRQNMSGCRIQENTELLSAFHSNLVTLISSLPKMSRMAQMPPLPVKLNQELAVNILGKSGQDTPPMS